MLDLLFRGRTLVFDSPLSHDDVMKRLQREVAPAVWRWRPEDRPHTFEGSFSDRDFRFVRLVRGKNSFRPIIHGRLVPGPNGVRIEVQLKLHPAVVIICAILFAVGGVSALIVASELPSAPQESPPLIAMVAAGLLFSVFLVMPAVEAREATRLLSDLFESQPRPERGLSGSLS